MTNIVAFPNPYGRDINGGLTAWEREERRRVAAEIEAIRQESEALRHAYQERQQRVDRLLERIRADAERV